MKRFSLEEYLKDPSQKVVTKGGMNVRILCTDRNYSDFPIVALMEREGEEIVISCNSNGVTVANPSLYSLFFASPEPAYRPYKDSAECFVDARKHGGWVKSKWCDEYHFVCAVGTAFVQFRGTSENWGGVLGK